MAPSPASSTARRLLVAAATVLAMVLTLVTAPAQKAAATDGWSGQVSLTSSAATVAYTSPTVTLTATTTAPVAAPYTLAIYDQTGALAAWCGKAGTGYTDTVCPAQGSGSSLSITASVPDSSTRTFVAYVSTTPAHPVLIPTAPLATAPAVQVANPGWTGTTATLSASATLLPLGTTTSQLSVTTDQPVAAPYTLAIYDSSGARVAWCGHAGTGYTDVTCPASGPGSVLTSTVSVAMYSTKTFTAYVSKTPANPAIVPTTDVRALSSPVAVSNPGWTGHTASVTVDRPIVTLQDTTATVTAVTDVPVAQPYNFVLVNSNGIPVAWCGKAVDSSTALMSTIAQSCAADPSGPGSKLSYTFQVPNASTATFTAYVAQDVPFTTRAYKPTNDVRATSAPLSVTNPGWTGHTASVTVDRPVVTLQNTTATVTAVTDVPVAQPYNFVLVNSNGIPVAWCGKAIDSSWALLNTIAQNCAADPSGPGSKLSLDIPYTTRAYNPTNQRSARFRNVSRLGCVTLTIMDSTYVQSGYDPA